MQRKRVNTADDNLDYNHGELKRALIDAIFEEEGDDVFDSSEASPASPEPDLPASPQIISRRAGLQLFQKFETASVVTQANTERKLIKK